MKIRSIITLPDPILRQTAKPIERIDADLRRLIDDMLATMYDAPGIGLAAPQIGTSRRLIVMDPAKEDQPKTPMVMVNPEILERSKEMRTTSTIAGTSARLPRHPSGFCIAAQTIQLRRTEAFSSYGGRSSPPLPFALN